MAHLRCPHCNEDLTKDNIFYIARNKRGYTILLKTMCAAAKREREGFEIFKVKFSDLKPFKFKKESL